MQCGSAVCIAGVGWKAGTGSGKIGAHEALTGVDKPGGFMSNGAGTTGSHTCAGFTATVSDELASTKALTEASDDEFAPSSAALFLLPPRLERRGRRS